MALLDQQAQEQVAQAASVAAKASTAALGGQFVDGVDQQADEAVVVH